MNKRTQHSIAIGLGIALIIGSNITGHYAGPFSISATPILLPIIIAVLNYRFFKLNFLATVLYSFGLLLFNDLLVRYFAAGTHDKAGEAIVQVSFIAASILAILIMTIYAFTSTKHENRKDKLGIRFVKILIVMTSAFLTGLIYHYGIIGLHK